VDLIVPLRSSGVEVEVSASDAGVAGKLNVKSDRSNSRDANAENSIVQMVQITILIFDNTKLLSRLSLGLTPRKCTGLQGNVAEVPSLGMFSCTRRPLYPQATDLPLEAVKR